MDDVKSFIKSKTLWGVAIALLGNFVDLPISTEAATDSVVLLAESGLEFFGAALATYGRFTAKTTLTAA